MVEVEIESGPKRNAFVEYITALISQHPVQGLETRNLIQIPNRGLYVLHALPLQCSPLLTLRATLMPPRWVTSPCYRARILFPL